MQLPPLFVQNFDGSEMELTDCYCQQMPKCLKSSGLDFLDVLKVVGDPICSDSIKILGACIQL